MSEPDSRSVRQALSNRVSSLIGPVDRALLSALVADGRATYAELGKAVGLSAPAAHERVRKLEALGAIRGYHAEVPALALGFGVAAIVGVFTREGVDQEEVSTRLRAITAIEDCWAVAGEETFLVKVRATDVDDLEATLNVLRRLEGVARTRTTVVLSSHWEGRLPPAP